MLDTGLLGSVWKCWVIDLHAAGVQPLGCTEGVFDYGSYVLVGFVRNSHAFMPAVAEGTYTYA